MFLFRCRHVGPKRFQDVSVKMCRNGNVRFLFVNYHLPPGSRGVEADNYSVDGHTVLNNRVGLVLRFYKSALVVEIESTDENDASALSEYHCRVLSCDYTSASVVLIPKLTSRQWDNGVWLVHGPNIRTINRRKKHAAHARKNRGARR